ncbi:MAG TPA: glycosyltransferase [Solirubrobacteraceae bacterium]|jgi:glycosyltransferase involved in cell wall biosynthesis|nr:glycosyltransferase [Solirubrobacteraceae bacterium]
MSEHSIEHSPLDQVRLGVFLNMPMHEVNGEYTARYPHLFDFFLALGTRTAETVLVLPLKRGGVRNPDYGTVTLPPNVRVYGLPHWSSARMLVRRIHVIAPATVWMAATSAREFDIAGAVVPSVVGTILIAAARLRRRPAFLLVRGEKQRTVRWMMGDRRARPYVAALRAMEAPVRHWIRSGVPTFVAGHELVDRYGAPGALLHDLYPALSRDFPVAHAPRTNHSRPGALALVTVARLSGEKGIDDLLRAVATLGELGTSATLEIVGEGPDRADLEAIAHELGIREQVSFSGFIPHGPRLVAALDAAEVFVLPSRSEGLPHSLVEAMARAVPVVATAIGGIPAFLRGGEGVVVPVGDPGALAAALAELARDPARLAELSVRALERARRVLPEAQLGEFSARLVEAYPILGSRSY